MTCLAKDLLPSSWAASWDGVGGSVDQRHLGPDDDEVRPPPGRHGGDGDRVGGIDRERLGDRPCAGVAGRAGQRGHRGVGGQSDAQGVLPGTGADHQYAHGSRR
jgi:hypothetical protein